MSVFRAHLIPLRYTLPCSQQSIVVAVELANLSIKICAVLLYTLSAIDCCFALLSDLIKSITGRRNVAHDVVSECVSLMCK